MLNLTRSFILRSTPDSCKRMCAVHRAARAAAPPGSPHPRSKNTLGRNGRPARGVEPETREAAVAALDALRAELEAKGVPVKEGSWGYRLLVVDDPDGNQLFFNYPN